MSYNSMLQNYQELAQAMTLIKKVQTESIDPEPYQIALETLLPELEGRREEIIMAGGEEDLT
jgi:hypothetical protein